MFEPGTQVMCVDDRFSPGTNDIYNALPVVTGIYTVRDVVPGMDAAGQETVAVYLKELVNRPNRHGIEPGFAVWRFAEPDEVLDALVEERENEG